MSDEGENWGVYGTGLVNVNGVQACCREVLRDTGQGYGLLTWNGVTRKGTGDAG